MIFNSSGQSILNTSLFAEDYLDIQSFPKGIYLARWATQNDSGILKLSKL
jgi:hypothetical protein